jgi:hypothetical protein
MDGKSAIDRHNLQTRRVARQRAAIEEREERGDYHEYPEDDPIEAPSNSKQAGAEGNGNGNENDNDNYHFNTEGNTDLSDFLLNVGKVWAKARLARA